MGEGWERQGDKKRVNVEPPAMTSSIQISSIHSTGRIITKDFNGGEKKKR